MRKWGRSQAGPDGPVPPGFRLGASVFAGGAGRPGGGLKQFGRADARHRRVRGTVQPGHPDPEHHESGPMSCHRTPTAAPGMATGHTRPGVASGGSRTPVQETGGLPPAARGAARWTPTPREAPGTGTQPCATRRAPKAAR